MNEVAVSADRTAVAMDRAAVSGAGFGKKVMAGFAGFAVADLLAHAVSAAAKYQQSMTLIQTQAGASAKEVKNFSAALLTLGPKVATGPEDLSVSLYHVYSALKKVGATAPQMLNTVKIAAEGAKVGMAPLEDTTNSLTATLASGIVKFNEASKAMGYLNAIVGAGDMHFSDLNQALGTGLLVTMKTFGVSLKDTGAALAVFGDNNIRGADAATKLRMAVQDLSKGGANADAALAPLHLTTEKLRSALENRGLNAALHLLKQRLDAAGITGSKIGGLLQDAFTKKAGAGLAILLTRLDQFDAARATETKAANSFGAAWTATTHTAAFAFQRLGAMAQSAEIAIGNKLLPSVAAAAQWLGAHLPNAIHTLGAILTPLAHTVGTMFADAWHVATRAVSLAGSALSGVGHFLADNAGAVKNTAIAVGAMWAAYKGFTILSAAVTAIRGFVTATSASLRSGTGAISQWGAAWRGTLAGTGNYSALASLSMQKDMLDLEAGLKREIATLDEAAAQTAEDFAAMARASDSFTVAAIRNADEQAAAARATANASAESAVEVTASARAAQVAVDESGAAATTGWAALAGPIGIAVVGVAAFAGALFHSSSAAKASAVEVQGLTDAINSDSGALGKNTAARVANTLQQSGAADMARQLGVNLGQLGAAALHGGAPLDSLVQRLHAIALANSEMSRTGRIYLPLGQQANELIGILTGESSAVVRAGQAYRDKTAIMHGATGATQKDASATSAATQKALANALAIKQQQQALAAATTALFNFITAELSQKSAALGFQAGLLGLAANIKQTGTSLDDNTVKGNANRQMLIGLFQSAEQAASGAKNQSAAMIANVAALKQHTIAAGFDKSVVDKLIRTLHLTPRDIRSKLSVDASQPNRIIDALRYKIESLSSITIGLHASGTVQGRQVFASGGHVRGPGTATSDSIPARLSNGEYVVNARQTAKHAALLEAINRGAKGFANGGLVGLAQSAGWRGRQAQIAAAIAEAESSGNARALNNNPGTGDLSYGLWQINMIGGMGPARRREFGIGSNAALFNPATNARAAHRLFMDAGGSFSPWSTYNSGAYQQYLGAGGGIHNGGGSGGGGASGGPSQAQQRAQARRQQHVQSINTLRSGLESWIHSFGSVGSERQAFRSLLPTLRDLGASKQFIAHVERENRALDNAIRKRIADYGRLQKAEAALHRARQAMRQERGAVSSAVRGFFDLTGAGANANGVVTAGGMAAQEKQALITIRKWAHGMHELQKRGLSDVLLRQFAQAGPSTWPQVQALLAASPSLFRSINQMNAQIRRDGSQFGSWESRHQWMPDIRHDRRAVAHDRRIEHRDERRIALMAKHLVAELDRKEPDIHVTGTVEIKDSGKAILHLHRKAERQEKHAGRRVHHG